MATYSAFTGNGPVAVNAGVQASRGVEFYVTSTAWLLGLRIYVGGTTGTGALSGRVYLVGAGGASGAPVASTDITFPAFTTAGWQTAIYGTPISLTVNTRYRAAVFSRTYESETGAYFTTGPGSAGINAGPLVIPNRANSTGTRQGSYNVSGALAFPGDDPGGTNYWVDVTVTNVDPAAQRTTDFFSFLGGF